MLAQLTAREVEVLKLIARAQTNAEIGANLFISEHTARTHVARILSKLNLNDRTQAASYSPMNVVLSGQAAAHPRPPAQ